ncbi:hypothetical protein BGW36DRAFT_464317 [Talaromyces proteolyticus]|uniref:F-box domain-containing protein n=1 Tax=Talaromyces proteolyticus TaxID=1131652 RepID=A0AAD4KQD7_9EURO|nr:uncharacterized protein BGW36DRAFT_464317 [Talaromyces proteolyticus]KAH8693129.1 hypothetical protein BGW36DRAFT_464317 [Talaromyces proteolyticus]
MSALNPPIFRLPLELTQHIASFLPNADLCAFTLTCCRFAGQVLSPHSSIWGEKFRDQYDLIGTRKSKDLKIEYQTRALVLSQDISLGLGGTEEGYLWLEVLHTLLLETYFYTRRSNSSYPSKNLIKIEEVIRDLDFLQRPLPQYDKRTQSEPYDLFCVVQLCLTHLSLGLETSVLCSRSDYNIDHVYSYGKQFRVPIVVNSSVDLQTLLHIRNFWQRHLTSTREDTFLNSYRTLIERPDTWTSPFKPNDEFKASWLGYYSCIHPYPKTSKALKSDQTCENLGIHGPTFANSLRLSVSKNPQNWPGMFNTIIPMSESSPSRTFFRGIQRYHDMIDSPTYLVRGFLEPILEAQGDFPGWTRICFVDYDANREFLPLFDHKNTHDEYLSFPDEQWPPVDLHSDFLSIYGFEGVLLPGGRIILGQWLDMQGEGTGECDRGPFIFWEM